MTISTVNDSDISGMEAARYKQYISWTFIAASIFGVLQLYASRAFDVQLLAFTGAVVLAYNVCLLAAMRLLRRGRIHVAVLTSSIGLLVAAFLLTITLPIANPAVSILPLMAIAHALPFLPNREIRLIIFASWLIEVSVISFDVFFPSSMGLPMWFAHLFRISSFGAVLGIVLLLLWQFANRLSTMLAQTRATNVSLEKTTTQLKAANEELKQFSSIVSHDLRAPLLNIRGFARELRFALDAVEKGIRQDEDRSNADQLEALSETLDKDIPEALEFIDSSVAVMDGYLTALLKLARLGRRELHFETVNVEDIVSETLKTLGHKIEMDRVKIEIGALPEVYADRMAVVQIFGNILTNAVKYLEPSRPGRVNISAEGHANETVFSIQDNGRGIARSDYSKIFTPLRRAGRQDVPGEGMGLSYVQTLVRLHGGEIWFESEPDVGTTFFFSISTAFPNESNHG